MTQDEIIEMARQAGWKDLRDYDSEMRNDIFMGSTNSLEAFAKLVDAKATAKEREACALICENYADTDSYQDETSGGITTDFHAKLIRARGKA